jgi:ferric-dicitrate binding protein FerR (iron transport regulator)
MNAWVAAVVLAMCGLLFAMGCTCGRAPMAKLTAKDGVLQRDYAAEVETWKVAEVGSEFEIGDALRTEAAATGTVAFDDGALMKLEPSTTVRFLSYEPGAGEKSIDIQAGEATLEAGDGPLRIRTQLGVAVLGARSVTRLSKSDRGLRILVTVGLAQLETANGEQQVTAGKGVEVGIGMAILDRFEDDTAAPATSAADAAPTGSDVVPKDATATVSGNGASVRIPGASNFVPLPPGEHFLVPGTQLKLAKGDEAKLERGRAGAELSGPGTFLVVEDPRRIVEPVTGSVTLRADGKDVSMEIPSGSLTALGSEELSIGEVQVDQKGHVRVRVRAGKVRVDLAEGSSTLAAGETGDIQGGKLVIGGRGLGFSDLSVGAGGSLLVHDPAPPTAVRVTFGDKCDGVGVVERKGPKGGGSASGTGEAALAFPEGRSSYELYCLGADGKRGNSVARGSVTVLADAGTMALPVRAPSNVVNTDGRDYTLLYQNLLPAVTVRWPNAPQANSYTLVVTSAGRSQRVSASTAVHAFAPGKLAEGSHTFQWTAESGRKSRPSKATIRFDNAAPKASIVSPPNGGFAAGSSVAVSGIALPGWEVHAQGARLPMDSEQRFAGTVASGPRGVVLTFTHPDRGVHYYLRRASGITR